MLVDESVRKKLGIFKRCCVKLRRGRAGEDVKAENEKEHPAEDKKTDAKEEK